MLQFALLIGQEDLTICQLNPTEQPTYKKLSFDDLETEELDICFIGELEEELLQKIGNHMFKFPIVPIKKTDITPHNFKEISFEQGQELYLRIQENWVLNNNISLIDELYPLTKHLKELWHKERITCLEELWSLIKRNLGCRELTIIFNDLEQKGAKQQLVQAKIKGKNSGHFEKGGELEEKLMLRYKVNPEYYLELLEFNQEKGETLLSTHIQQSPLLIMAKSQVVNQLQLSLLKTLFEGLSLNLIQE